MSAQRQDPAIQEVVELLSANLAENKVRSPEAKQLLQKRKQLVLVDGILCKKSQVTGQDMCHIIDIIMISLYLSSSTTLLWQVVMIGWAI